MPLLSIVTPAYNEAANLPVLHQRLSLALGALGGEWEWIVVDDHSADDTFTVLKGLAAADSHVKALRLARNFGSHVAIYCGIQQARGDAIIVIAADLQDPPELITSLVDKWRQGAQIVWAVRGRREGEPASALGFARLYYWLMRRMGIAGPATETGSDFFLLDRQVADVLDRFNESHVNVFVLLAWMGFRQQSVVYDKERRLHGRSGWTLEKKLKLAIDSVTSFTYFPIRAMSYLGVVVALIGFAYAIVVAANAFAGNPVQGWSSLMVVVLVVGGMQMLMMGVLGEYVWRALAEARRRPRYVVEERVP